MITYNGYTALLEVDIPSGLIVGHVIGIRDEIAFSGKTTEETIAGFHRAVDFYLGRLAEAGQKPERPFSGRFNVRIEPVTHRGLVIDAEARKISLNDVVKQAFAAYLERASIRIEGVESNISGPEQADLVVKGAGQVLSIEAKRRKLKQVAAEVERPRKADAKQAASKTRG